MNGVGEIKQQSRSVTPSSYLGKRKRSTSPEKHHVNGSTETTHHHPDSNIDNVIREIKKHDLAPTILERPLPTLSLAAPSFKKQKFDDEAVSIETRLACNAYANVGHLLADLRQVLVSVRNDEAEVNGKQEELNQIEVIIDGYGPQEGPATDQHIAQPIFHAGEVLTVRSNVEGGHPRQLFTALRLRPSGNAKPEEIDVRKLPGGFDVVEATAIDVPRLSAQQDSRTFGEVFRQIRNVRQLEQPQSSRGTSNTTLSFQKPFEHVRNVSKDDYRNASLSPGFWLDYATTTSDPKIVYRQRPTLSKSDPEALFKASFSSFAPSEDNSTAIVSRAERYRRWYRKHGPAALQKILSIDDARDPTVNPNYPEIDDDFQHLIDDFEPVAMEGLPSDVDTISDEKDILDEISELLQTLSSYQQIRDLDRTRLPDASVTPSAPETKTFELLREHLRLLVAALPPFAVAKLDGEQLERLNISTNITFRAPDIAGTGQPDDGTIQRQRQTQAQQTAMARPINPQAPRNSYTSASPAVPYGSQARSFSSSLNQTPSMPGYAQRNAQIYNTPRAGIQGNANQYSQTPYQRQQQPYPGATIQQYQRMQNGYAQTLQTPYQQRNAQTPFQPQAQVQNNLQYGRGASPAKPMVNGQGYTSQTSHQYTPRNQYTQGVSSTNLLQGSYAQANAQATIQQIKAAQQANMTQGHMLQSQSPQPQPMQGVQQTNAVALQAQQQRQGSGTPQPPSQQQQTNVTAPVIASAGGAAVSNAPRASSSQPEPPRLTPTPTSVTATVDGA